MAEMTRRAFIGSTAAVAAGAAVGLTASKGFREHGPVKIQFDFFGPVVIEGRIFSDERRNIFGVRTFDKGKEMGRFELRLSNVKEIVASPSKTARLLIRGRNKDGKIEGECWTSVIAADGNLTFLVEEELGKHPSPIWMPLVDVQRVL